MVFLLIGKVAVVDVAAVADSDVAVGYRMTSHGIGRYHLTSFDVGHSGPLLKSYCGTIALLEFPHKCISTSEFFQKAPKGALRPFSVAALLHYVL